MQASIKAVGAEAGSFPLSLRCSPSYSTQFLRVRPFLLDHSWWPKKTTLGLSGDMQLSKLTHRQGEYS